MFEELKIAFFKHKDECGPCAGRLGRGDGAEATSW
jgi:hypothetical protein